MFHTCILVHQPTQTWNRAKVSPSCAIRGLQRLSNYRLSFDKVAWLYNLLVFPLLMVLFCLYGHFVPFWNPVTKITPFAQCVFVFVVKEGVWVSKWEKGRGRCVHGSSVGSPESE